MSEERDWAAFYEQHKDNPEIWGEPEEGTPPARGQGLSATITVRFPPEEAAKIRDLAKVLGVSYSDIVRTAVRAFIYPRSIAGYKDTHFPIANQVWPRLEHEQRISCRLSNARTSTGSLALVRE